MYLIRTSLWILIGLPGCYGRSSGPPSGTCPSMNPASHPGSAQSTASPYTISFSKSTYTDSEQIQVTLSGSPDFKGYFIQPRTSSSDTNTFGSITLPANSQNPCTGVVAISHSNSDAKSSVTFTWTAPAQDEGPIVFVYTVVQDINTYWVKEVSSALTYQSSGTTTTGANAPTTAGTNAPTTTVVNAPTTTQAPTTTVAQSALRKNSGCGSSVGCFDNCESDDCDFVCYWEDQGGDSVDFTIACKGTGDRYCGIGVSSDETMGDDSVFACVSESGTVSVQHFYNTDGKSNEPLDDNTFGLTLISSSHENGVISCTFQRKKTAALASAASGRRKRAASDDSTFFNLNDDWFLMFADGAYSSGFLFKHTTAPKVSCKKADFQGVADLTICSPSLVYVHATFMALAWMLFASFGIFTARFYKDVPPMDKEVLGAKSWFHIHRLAMIVVFLFNLTGFIVIFVHVEGYSEISGSGFKKSHPVIGIIVMALTFINPIMALLRPKPGTKYRPGFNVAHFCVGEGAFIFAILNLFSGTVFQTTNVPSYIRVILIVFVVWVVLVEGALFVYEQCFRTGEKSRMKSGRKVGDTSSRSKDTDTSDFEMQQRGETNATAPQQSGVHWKMIVMGFHGVVLLGFTLAAIIIVWTQRDD